MSLCAEAEQYIKDHNKKLSAAARARLATKSPKEQVQWLVNPLVMFCIERTMNQIWADLGTQRTAAPVKQAKPDPVSKPEPVPDDPSSGSDDDDGGMFDLFDD